MSVTATIDPGISIVRGGETKNAGVEFSLTTNGSVLCDQVNDALATATTDTPWTLSGTDYPTLIFVQSLTPSSGTAQKLFVSIGCNSHAIGMGIEIPAGGCAMWTFDGEANGAYQTAFSTADDVDSLKVRNESGNTAAYRVLVLR